MNLFRTTSQSRFSDKEKKKKKKEEEKQAELSKRNIYLIFVTEESELLIPF